MIGAIIRGEYFMIFYNCKCCAKDISSLPLLTYFWYLIRYYGVIYRLFITYLQFCTQLLQYKNICKYTQLIDQH